MEHSTTDDLQSECDTYMLSESSLDTKSEDFGKFYSISVETSGEISSQYVVMCGQRYNRSEIASTQFLEGDNNCMTCEIEEEYGTMNQSIEGDEVVRLSQQRSEDHNHINFEEDSEIELDPPPEDEISSFDNGIINCEYALDTKTKLSSRSCNSSTGYVECESTCDYGDSGFSTTSYPNYNFS